ncbi:hypothetical protein FF38_02908 [Lucilia cuprina]|uniref:Uncharacterized protein n=1 Tax=Lucilia cuprina TaxID=7375 RepID=A0A0L0CHT6_LUCCU|nr:hypothetical protein FF38_02908 [Lucilia cuprina]
MGRSSQKGLLGYGYMGAGRNNGPILTIFNRLRPWANRSMCAKYHPIILKIAACTLRTWTASQQARRSDGHVFIDSKNDSESIGILKGGYWTNIFRWSRSFTHIFDIYEPIGLILNSVLFDRISNRFIEISDLADIWGLLKTDFNIHSDRQTDGHG